LLARGIPSAFAATTWGTLRLSAPKGRARTTRRLAEEVGLPARTEEAVSAVDMQPPEAEVATWAEAMLRLGEVADIREPHIQPRAEEATEPLRIVRIHIREQVPKEAEWPEERDLPLCTSLRSSDLVLPLEESDVWT
jgi:hypothetical protein